MSKIKSFINRPRNIYFSIVLMLTLVSGLFSISFSYYIDESNTEGLLKVKSVDNRIQCDDLVDGYVTLAPHETKEINLYVMSNNNSLSKFALYYKTEDDAKVLSNVSIDETIDAKEVQQYELLVSNFESNPASIYIGILNGKIGDDLEVDGNLIEVTE